MRARAYTRRGFAALGLASLGAACGFSPVYAPESAGTALRGRILADPPGSRNAFAFVAQIEDRLGRPDPGDLRLAYRLNLRVERLALSPSGSGLRLAVIGTSTYRVLDPSGAELTSGRVESSASFTDRGTSVAVSTARNDARERASIILGNRVADRLLASAADWLP